MLLTIGHDDGQQFSVPGSWVLFAVHRSTIEHDHLRKVVAR
jgi:hypothetical protein